MWRNGDFLRFWLGETLSLLGTQVTNLALPLTAIVAFDATDEQVGVLRFLQLVPYLGLALVFGVWVDRARRRRIMLGANLVRAVLLALVPVLYWTDTLSLASLLVIACAVGVASVLFDVSWMSYVPTLVRDPRHYVEAGAKMGMSSSAADVAGPGLAGVLIGALTAPVALIVDAFSYLVSLISLLLIRTPEPRPRPDAGTCRPSSGTVCAGSLGIRSCGHSRSSGSAATSPWSPCGPCSCCTGRGTCTWTRRPSAAFSPRPPWAD
ncbi:MFS transporter [Streptomyces stramineus]